MLHVTEKALSICSATARQLAPTADTKCLRLIERDGNVSIAFEQPQGQDEFVHHGGNAVLAIPGMSVRSFSHMTLDVKADGRFILTQT